MYNGGPSCHFFATFYAGSVYGYKAFLALFLLEDKASHDVNKNVSFMIFVSGAYEKTFVNIAALMSDNCSSNLFRACELSRPCVNSANNQYSWQ